MASSPVLFRGEPDGALRIEGGLHRPWFFSERYDHALLYSGGRTGRKFGEKHRPIACVFASASPLKVLDLTQLDALNPDHMDLIDRLTAQFASEGWVDRYSGEEADVWSLLEGGSLYDYESSGSGERWNAMFRIALDDMGVDAVRVLDRTDGTQGEASVVWVTHRLDIIENATLGQELAALLQQPETQVPWQDIDTWLQAEHPDLIDRIKRLAQADQDYRLDQLHHSLPPSELAHIPHALHQDIWRSLPAGSDIRPGDLIALDWQYANTHTAVQGAEFMEVKKLDRVLNSDIYWAGTDINEFFYMPRKWVRTDCTHAQYLAALSPEQVEILCDGEMHSITRHESAIAIIRDAVMDCHNPATCGYLHGPAHWDRVNTHAMATSRDLGINPLIAHLFALVHDSQRENDGHDPAHGWRAAEWVKSNRTTLFAFLGDLEINLLARACEGHSDGHVNGPLPIQACWDADRLDLWRVDIEPTPQLLCGDYAKRSSVIADARRLTVDTMDEDHDFAVFDEFSR